MKCVECEGVYTDCLVIESVPDGDKQNFCSYACIASFVSRIL
jgi:hypothetical protein